jgi:glycosyltransferase involved in cell wall biosynthesis
VAEPLRVLFLATRDWYHPATTGGDNTMWENARYLASAGNEVTFLAAGFRGAAGEESLDGIHVVRFGGIHSLWLRTFIYYMSHCRGRFDVVVAEGFGGSRIPRLAPLYVREPIITEWHQVHRELFAAQYPALLGGPLNLLERMTAWVSRNTLVRAGTEEWRDAFVRLGFRPQNVFVVPVSIREEWLEEGSGGPVHEPNILWLGKIRRYKRPDHAIKALAAVVKVVPRARLTIAGRHDDLAYERRLQSLVDELGLRGHVEFRFDLTEDEKRALLRRTRVLVLPSVVEGFGIVVLEANACGVPVVASSGVPQGAVRQGKNGLRYLYGDVAALAAALCQVLQDDTVYSQLAAGGREFAREFAWEKVGSRFAQVVEDAVAARRRNFSPQRDDSAAKVS